MWGEIKLPIAYESLDTAVARYLPGSSTTWVEFTREQVSSGGAIYHLDQRLLGDLGKITIRKVSATETTMLIIAARISPAKPDAGRDGPYQGHRGQRGVLSGSGRPE